MASVSPSAWTSPPGTSISAPSSPASRKPVLALPSLKHAKGRRLGALAAVHASSSEPPARTPDEPEEPAAPERVKLAFARAKAYQKEKPSGPAAGENPVGGSGPLLGDGDSVSEVPDSLKLAMERASEYRDSRGAVAVPIGVPIGSRREDPAVPKSLKLEVERAGGYKENAGGVEVPGNSSERSSEMDRSVPDSVKLGMERAREYKKNKDNSGAIEEPSGYSEENSEVAGTVSDAAKLAMERAREYTKNKDNAGSVEELGASEAGGEVGWAIPDSVKLAMERASEYKKNKGAKDSDQDVSNKLPNRTGLFKTNMGNPESIAVDDKVQKPGELKVSSLDFLGLDFSEKKNRGVPAGLVPVVDTFADEDLPEVEIIVGDDSKFGSSAPSKLNLNEPDENVGLYKPKVSTWGVFPRPSNISETFGGGRNIRPGEVLESAEVKAAKEESTRQLIASYKSKIGLTIDAKMKADCEKSLEEGDRLMDIGKLWEALPYYEKIMKNLAFQSELHGIAALQWSICQDSLRRPDEARVMYERLQSHPSVEVSKKARQFMFGFQAMEMMKVSSYSVSKITGYEDYFNAFLEDSVSYAPTAVGQDENALVRALPYMIFLVSPVFVALVIAIRKLLEL